MPVLQKGGLFARLARRVPEVDARSVGASGVWVVNARPARDVGLGGMCGVLECNVRKGGLGVNHDPLTVFPDWSTVERIANQLEFSCRESGRGCRWRATPRVLGQINGLPESRGVLVATDGVLCQIVREDGTTFEGHVQWFVATNQKEQSEVRSGGVSRSKQSTSGKKRLEVDYSSL